MKKKLAGILAVLMVLSMGTTVFAAGSSDKDTDMEKEVAALQTTVESGNNSVQLTSTAVTPDELTSAYDKVNEVVESSTGFQVLAAVQISTVSALPQGGVSVKINVPGIQAGTKNVRVYHKKPDGSWEIKTPYVGNGYVTAPFDSFSPFFVVKYDSAPSTSDGSVDASTVVNNYYNTTNNTNTTNTTDNSTTTNNNTNTSNNSSSTSNTNSTFNTTNSNNNATNSYNASTNSNNASTSNTTTNNGPTVKKESTTSTKKETTAKKSTVKKTAKKTNTKKPSTSGDKNSSEVSNNTQTVTVNVNSGGSNSGSSSLKAGATTSTTSPKTGASMPVLPIIAGFALMGIAVCGKKARNL